MAHAAFVDADSVPEVIVACDGDLPEAGETMADATYIFGYILYYTLPVAWYVDYAGVAPIGGLSSHGSAGCFDSAVLDSVAK